VQRNEIAPRHQRIDALNLGCIALCQNFRCDGASVLHKNFHAKAMVSAVGHGPADATKANDAQRLARDF